MNAGTTVSMCAPGRATPASSPSWAPRATHAFIIKSVILTACFALSLITAGEFQPHPSKPELLVGWASQDEMSTRDISDSPPEMASLADQDDYVELLSRAGIVAQPASRH
jgi:hypothetical protein